MNFSGSKYQMWLNKPVPFVPQEIPKNDTWKLNLDEGQEGFEWATERLNFLSEMFKFFPDYLNNVFMDIESEKEVLNQFGKGEIDPEVAAKKGYGNNTPWDSTPGRGYDNDLFGFLHPQIYDGKYWGAGYGAGARKNLNCNPNAGETSFIKNSTQTYNYSLADDPAIYAKRAFAASFDASRLGDYSKYTKEALSLLAGSGQSYYEIAMSGINTTSISIIDGKKIDYNATKWGNYTYDNWTDKDAFLFMVGITRSRRLISTAMSELICRTDMIANKGQKGPDDAGIIKNFDSWMNDPNRGKYLNSNNLRTFSLFFAANHHLRGMNAALTGGVGYEGKLTGPSDLDGLGDLGYNGEIRSARETVALKRFRSFIRSKSASYVNSLSGSEQTNAQKILNEGFYLKDDTGSEIPQPWSAYVRGEQHSDFVGWDAYTTYWDPTTGAAPENLSPYANNLHQDYAISQIEHLELSQLVGRTSVNGKNLFQNNWVVHVFGTFKEADQSAKQKIITTFAQNSVMSLDSRRKMNKYQDDKIEATRKQEEEEWDNVLSERAAAIASAESRASDNKVEARMAQGRKESENRSRAKKEQNKPKKQDKAGRKS